jgi:hypothetical protein
MALMMVLNDGETFSNIEGCMVVDVPEEWSSDQIEEELKNYMFEEQDPNLKEIGTFGENCIIQNNSISFKS